MKEREANEGEKKDRHDKRRKTNPVTDVVDVVNHSEVTDLSLSPKSKCHVTLKSS